MANKAPSKTTAPVSSTSNEDFEEEFDLEAATAAFDAAGGEEVLGTGFAPYLKPQVGGLYTFIPLMVDARDPSFVRYTCQNTGKDLRCATGPVDDGEEVIVKKGEIFSISKYATLPLIEMMGLSVTAFCSGTQKLGPIKVHADPSMIGKPRSPMYTFKFKLSTEDTLKFKAARANFALEQANAQRQLAAHNASNLPVTPSNGPARAHQTQLGG